MTHTSATFVCVTVLTLVGAGCNRNATAGQSTGQPEPTKPVASSAISLREDPGDPGSPKVTRAIATLTPTKGNHVTGVVKFTQTAGGVKVDADVNGLPEGVHAYHIHLYGDCSGDDGKSAGTHLNLQGSSKHPPPDIARITGDLGELTADATGHATAQRMLSTATLQTPNTIIGRSVIVHAKGNDLSAPPIGAAGSRLACGVIGVEAG